MEEILKQLEFLLERYSKERRATTQPYLFEVAQESVPGYVYRPEDFLIRETLIEHVGSLPIVATALYPHIADDEVSLGDALTMLAIHDIGELKTGDENTFTKKADEERAEYKAALSLLHPSYHQIYDDSETKASKSAKFAKAIDKITPDIFDYLTPAEITIQRFKHFVGIGPDEIIATIVRHKRPYMAWNPFMTEFHIHLIGQLEAKLEKHLKG